MFPQEIISALMEGKRTVRDYFVSVTQKWTNILGSQESKSTDELAHIVEREQGNFVMGRPANDWPLIKEIIGIVAVAQFWTPNDGFGDRETRARQVCAAIQRSGCSGEIKESAKEAAKAYGLTD